MTGPQRRRGAVERSRFRRPGGENAPRGPFTEHVRSNRLTLLPAHALPGGLRVVETTSFSSRVLGLALLDDLEPDTALLIRRCSSVHTLGMMFSIDVVFLDELGEPVKVAAAVRPSRLVGCRGAVAVLETPAGGAERFLAAGAGKIAAGLGPPRPRPGEVTEPRERPTGTEPSRRLRPPVSDPSRPRPRGGEGGRSAPRAQAPRSR